ncbi:cytochrome bd-I ubiquinol oxidase subunit 1 apoprotein [Halorientalis persicus]|uniref:Cytochrome bd-I ubiquinol oxidase subunit 1 apoprotein n=1 Tax=Halorientalis persicus TaxID=1367881 RepID=A0A1H8VQC2_9EURY|nr:cytochrome ubiquinol oxidase subunit I [Halorientalis persicus]SEP17473.1 cytochrome bd-I ubiquinol oxidase subunit 1 apoprotein [Halorientalis persicus]
MIDPVIASRLQFAVTTIVHIIFPVMSMGLAPFLVYFTWKEIRTEEQVYEQLRAFWTKIFAISFVVGTVTGIVLEFEFGTNFAAFSTAAGELFGGPLAIEGMMAFMLEATFLGIFVFGRDEVGDLLYMLSSIFVGLGTWLSAVWILIANSWMQTPRGFEVARESGQPVISLVDPIAAYANPRFPWMYVHMQSAAVLSVALFITGVAAYYVWTNRDTQFWRKTMKAGLAVLFVTAPFQAIHGDAYGRHVAETQPQKFAAMEAQYDTHSSVGLKVLAFPTSLEDITDPHAEDLFIVEIPFVASLLASGGDPGAEITGLNDIPAESPPVAIVFWAFRAMVGLGMWFILLAFWGGYRWFRGELFEDDMLAKALVGSSVLGIVTVELGWIVTEVGRQPWVIQGVMKTHAGVSPGLTGAEALATLAGFVGVYSALLVLYWYVVVRLIREEAPTRPPTLERDTPGAEEVVPNDD